MLVINWGDKTPVIHSFGKEGALDSEWADGSESETLTPGRNGSNRRRRRFAAGRRISCREEERRW
jgi:hypothetical protein